MRMKIFSFLQSKINANDFIEITIDGHPPQSIIDIDSVAV